MIGYPLDTTLAIMRLVLAGVLEKYPGLKLILSHLGGTIPYLVDRIDFCYSAYPECRVNIPRPPSEYLRSVYLDTVSFYAPALWCALAFSGPDRLLLGSDYPHVIGDLNRAIAAIEGLNIPQEHKEGIFGANVKALLGIA
jgi:aminocarboxymuconate-semialdehyde decarboxylase